MKDYIINITPFVQSILELTKKREIEWEKTADSTYRCIAEYEGISLEISKYYNVLVENAVSVQLYSESRCLFSYSREIIQKYPDFDNLLLDLFAEVEAAYLEKITNCLSRLVGAFTHNKK